MFKFVNAMLYSVKSKILNWWDDAKKTPSNLSADHAQPEALIGIGLIVLAIKAFIAWAMLAPLGACLIILLVVGVITATEPE